MLWRLINFELYSDSFYLLLSCVFFYHCTLYQNNRVFHSTNQSIKYFPIVHKWSFFQEWMITSWLHVVMYLFQNPLFISVIQSILKRCRVQVFVFLSWTISIHFDYKQKKPKVGKMNQIPRSNYVHLIHYFSGNYDLVSRAPP